jgi:hypothetical protein
MLPCMGVLGWERGGRLARQGCAKRLPPAHRTHGFLQVQPSHMDMDTNGPCGFRWPVSAVREGRLGRPARTSAALHPPQEEGGEENAATPLPQLATPPHASEQRLTPDLAWLEGAPEGFAAAGGGASHAVAQASPFAAHGGHDYCRAAPLQNLSPYMQHSLPMPLPAHQAALDNGRGDAGTAAVRFRAPAGDWPGPAGRRERAGQAGARLSAATAVAAAGGAGPPQHAIFVPAPAPGGIYGKPAGAVLTGMASCVTAAAVGPVAGSPFTGRLGHGAAWHGAAAYVCPLLRPGLPPPAADVPQRPTALPPAGALAAPGGVNAGERHMGNGALASTFQRPLPPPPVAPPRPSARAGGGAAAGPLHPPVDVAGAPSAERGGTGHRLLSLLADALQVVWADGVLSSVAAAQRGFFSAAQPHVHGQPFPALSHLPGRRRSESGSRLLAARRCGRGGSWRRGARARGRYGSA